MAARRFLYCFNRFLYQFKPFWATFFPCSCRCLGAGRTDPIKAKHLGANEYLDAGGDGTEYLPVDDGVKPSQWVACFRDAGVAVLKVK